jgi:Holliday junction DNA helicase RuvA
VIGKLTGTLDSVSGDAALIDVNGVGYVVHAASRTLARLGPNGGPVSLLIETHVREDAINLYGFWDATERDWFRLLTTVQGVGAKVALAILGILAPDDLSLAIAAQDKAIVSRAPGVGPKLAQRIVSELKDKAGNIALGSGAVAPAVAVNGSKSSGGAAEDAISALVNLGYRRAEAYGAVAKAARDLGERASLDALIRAGLKELSQ